MVGESISTFGSEDKKIQSYSRGRRYGTHSITVAIQEIEELNEMVASLEWVTIPMS